MMKQINIAMTSHTPSVNFNPENGILEMKGRSIPEENAAFFNPLIEWLEQYKQSAQSETVFNVSLEYINSGTHTSLYLLFKKLEEIYKLGRNVIINWHYEEDDEYMLETGEEYRYYFTLPFNLIKVKEF